MKNIILLIAFLLNSFVSFSISAAAVTKEQIKGLDEQVQEIKKYIL